MTIRWPEQSIVSRRAMTGRERGYLQGALHQGDGLPSAGGTEQSVRSWPPRLEEDRGHGNALLCVELAVPPLFDGGCTLLHCCQARQRRRLFGTLIILQACIITEIEGFSGSTTAVY